MVTFAQESRLNPRARIVCHECHSRKVKCDLQNRTNSKCSNCQKYNHDCRRRASRRVRTVDRRVMPSNTPNAEVGESLDDTQQQQPQQAQQQQQQQQNGTSPAYMGDRSLLTCPGDSFQSSSADEGALPASETHIVLRATRADWLPSKIGLEASAEFYFQHVYPGMPVLERSDLLNSSLLLQQTVQFAGCLVRKADVPNGLEETYSKIRTLLYLNIEPSKLVVLKSLCFLACWGPKSPDVLTLESAWHWCGMAMRLALQMGLHREESYKNFPDADIKRRLWWSIFNIEVIQGISYGRPAMYNRGDFDVEVISAANISDFDQEAKYFQVLSNLSLILADLQRINISRQPITVEETFEAFQSLVFWFDSLTDELLLFNDQGVRKKHHTPTLQLHICFLCTFIMYALLPGKHRQSHMLSIATYVASCCVVHMYASILQHEEEDRLFPHHSWMVVIAAIPQVFSASAYISDGRTTLSTVNAIETLTAVVTALSTKHASAKMVLRQLASFWHSDENLPNSVQPIAKEALSPLSSSESLSALEEEQLAIAEGLFRYPESHFPELTLLKRGRESANCADSNMQSHGLCDEQSMPLNNDPLLGHTLSDFDMLDFSFDHELFMNSGLFKI